MSHQAATALFARRSSFIQGYDHILSHYLVFHLELFPYQVITRSEVFGMMSPTWPSIDLHPFYAS